MTCEGIVLQISKSVQFFKHQLLVWGPSKITFRFDNWLEGLTETYILTMFITGKGYVKITQARDTLGRVWEYHKLETSIVLMDNVTSGHQCLTIQKEHYQLGKLTQASVSRVFIGLHDLGMTD